MRRWSRIEGFIKWCGISIATASVIGWAASIWLHPILVFGKGPPQYELSLNFGSFVFSIVESSASALGGVTSDRLEQGFFLGSHQAILQFPMPSIGGGISNLGITYHWWIVVPLWIPLLITGPPATWLLWKGRRRIPLGPCRKCGYNLTGNISGVCPECGEKI